ncbi:hypothetical protein ACR9E3_29685 [Actinomycetospora sp. C-140]
MRELLPDLDDGEVAEGDHDGDDDGLEALEALTGGGILAEMSDCPQCGSAVLARVGEAPVEGCAQHSR